MPRRILPCGNADPRRRADRGRNVKLFEERSFAGESINVLCFNICVAGATQIAKPHVIDQYENNIGATRCWCCISRERAGEMKEYYRENFFGH